MIPKIISYEAVARRWNVRVVKGVSYYQCIQGSKEFWLGFDYRISRYVVIE